MSVNSSVFVSSSLSTSAEMYAVFVQQGSGGVAGFAAARPAVMAGGGGRAYLADPTRWGAWAHQGHRLWASMAEEFWVYVYKVQRCPQPCSHDWTACPYAHKGERARRRDPRRFSYVGVSCPDYRAAGGGQPAPAACVRGFKCRYAHGVFELWLHPSRFRTRMCESGHLCPRPICFFAHSPADLRRDNAATAVVATPSPPPHVLLQRAAPSHATTTRSSPPPPPRDIHQPFDPAAEYSRSPFRAYYDQATGASSSTTVDVDPSSKCSRCAEEEESMVHDYPHVDLIMDLVR